MGKMIEAENTRLKWMDLSRAIAILCVILCHCTELTYTLNMDGIGQSGILSQMAAFVCFTIGRLGVPLFFMISGYLLLDKKYDTSSCIRFWKRNFLHLLIVTMIWWAIYDIYSIATGRQEFSMLNMLLDVVFLHSVNLMHTWYMPVILSLYLCVPLVANALNSVETRILKFPILIFFVYVFVFPFFRLVNNNILLGGGRTKRYIFCRL